MSQIYDSGMGGDQSAAMYEQMTPEGMRRKKLAGQASGISPDFSRALQMMQRRPQANNLGASLAQQATPLKQSVAAQAQAQQTPTAPRQPGTAAGQPQKTFAQMQQQGYARPNPPAPAPAPAQAPAPAPAGVQVYNGAQQQVAQAPAGAPAGAPAASVVANGAGLDIGAELARRYQQGSGISDEVSRGISGAIANPSAYNSDLVKNIYSQLGQDIDDDFAQRETGLREEMAARGLSDSSIQGGRLADLNVGRRSARQGLANQLGQMVAQDYSGARDRALGMGMARDQYGNQVGQSYLDRLMGFGQQAFDNDMQQAQFNRMLQNDQDQLMLQMFGLGG